MKTEIPGNRRTTDSLAVSPLRSSGLGVGMTRAVILSESTDFLQLSWDGILQGWLANHGRALEHSSDLPSYLFIPVLLGMLGPVKVLRPTATLLKQLMSLLAYEDEKDSSSRDYGYARSTRENAGRYLNAG